MVGWCCRSVFLIILSFAVCCFCFCFHRKKTSAFCLFNALRERLNKWRLNAESFFHKLFMLDQMNSSIFSSVIQDCRLCLCKNDCCFFRFICCFILFLLELLWNAVVIISLTLVTLQDWCQCLVNSWKLFVSCWQCWMLTTNMELAVSHALTRLLLSSVEFTLSLC